jgi:hypothetical protein
MAWTGWPISRGARIAVPAAGPQDEVEDGWQAFGRIEDCKATAAAFDATLAG